jgi:O-antigen biosynthesis protein
VKIIKSNLIKSNQLELKNSKVSVIIPVFNDSKYIEAAINSVFNQTYNNYEIIIIDDGSTDNTRDLLKSFEDQILYVYQENKGSAAARNFGIRLAKGELISFLDADDYWRMPEKLEKQVACFAEDSSLGCINTGWHLVDEEGNHLKTVQPWHKAPELNLETWLKQKCVRTSAMMFRRQWLEKVGGFDEELRQSHDVDLILRLSLAGCKTIWLKEETVCYRQHSENTTKNSIKQGKYVQAVLDKFFCRQDLPESISQMESDIRYYTLVWLAWYQCRSSNLDEMAKLLQKSLNFTPYLQVENIPHWLTSFKGFSEDCGENFNIGKVINSLQWQKLISSILTRTNFSQKSQPQLKANEVSTLSSDSSMSAVIPTQSSDQVPVKNLIKQLEVKKYAQTTKIEGFPPDLILPPFPGEGNNYSFIEKQVKDFVASKQPYSLSVSIIIPFCNSELILAKILAAIANQTYPQHLIETIVVDRGNSQQIAELIQKYQQEFEITQLKLAEKLDFGLKAAKYDYLVLLDRDMLPTVQLLEAYMKYFHISEQVVLIGDRKFVGTEQISEEAEALKLPDAQTFKDNWLREGDLEFLNTQHEIYQQSNFLKQERYPFQSFISSNIALPKKLIEKIGFFDSSISYWRFRDQEFGYRIYNEGYYFIPVMDALAFHQHPSEGREKPDKQINHKVEEELLEQKCPVNWCREYQPGKNYDIPKVSIYMPSYNNGKYIKEAVDSVLNQTYTDLEVCICDDGSTDNTLQVLEANFTDNPKVRWVTRTNGGIGKASNSAVKLCRGMYIGQLDSDDLVKPEAVATLVEYLETNDYGCVYSSCERIDAEGNYLQAEYSYPKFSREKMLITSIVHHFRMFRRRDWSRTKRFNEQLVNAVDYDMFLQLSEICTFHHLEKMLYFRRWHGNNTSFVKEKQQTTNTHIAITYALERMGLADDWEVYAPNPESPRKVSLRRKRSLTNLFFFPDYRQSNIYQNLFYSHISKDYSLYSGDIDSALQALKDGIGKTIFHLHWTNYILKNAQSLTEAEKFKNQFIAKLFEFLAEGGNFIWTIHNTIPHDCSYLRQEIELRNIICTAAQKIHIHSAKSLPEIQKYINLPLEKVQIIPHGNYVGVYPNNVNRVQARQRFGLSEKQTVFMFLGQIRKYKGIGNLIYAFSQIQLDFPNTHLLIAGMPKEPMELEALIANSEAKNKITLIQQYISGEMLQWFFSAVDVVVLPYRKILTSGSMLNAMSFGRPVIAPRVGMTEEIISDGHNGFLYELGKMESLIQAMSKIASLESQEKERLFKQSFISIQHLTWNKTALNLLAGV